MTFGDINGNDYWRLKAQTVQEKFVEPPRGEQGRGAFAVLNHYLDRDGVTRVCSERARYTIRAEAEGYYLIWDSVFFSSDHDFTFGDQEEFGLGIRVATPIAVQAGGRIRDNAGRMNEKQIWGQPAAWVDYSGVVEGRWVGATIIPDPGNFRPSWFHARDYGLLVANPFGREAMHAGPKSAVTVRVGESLRLRFALFFHADDPKAPPDLPVIHRRVLERLHQIERPAVGN
jgi:hypothetical protein